MYLFLKGVTVGIIYFFVVSYGYPVNSNIGAMMYLHNYGYLQESDGDITAYLKKPGRRSTTEDVDVSAFRTALRNFQKFFGLQETGKLDKQTLLLMNKPRCGVKDRMRNSKSVRRKRFALQGSKWRVHLTYRITKYPRGVKDKEIVNSEIARAFKVWSNATTIHFKEKTKGPVHINIRFEDKKHADEYPFDGPGHVLAHAFFPVYGGYVHFDDDENWTANSSAGTNLFQIATHEFGHALGLSHSNDTKAIMYPTYDGYNPDFKIHSDDIEGIQTLYGSQDELVNPIIQDEDEDEDGDKDEDTSKIPAYSSPNICKNATFDTIIRVKNDIAYIFKGDYYWKYLCNDLAYGYPRKISKDWDGLEGDLDASLTLPNGPTYFFKGNRYWRFTNKKMDKGYPKLIGSEGYVGIPPNLDAALVWSVNQKLYFFKGDKYWRYDFRSNPHVDKNYPASIKGWDGLPSDGINGAVSWENKVSYFFKDDKYYRFDDVQSKVTKGSDPPYPRSNADWWFNC